MARPSGMPRAEDPPSMLTVNELPPDRDGTLGPLRKAASPLPPLLIGRERVIGGDGCADVCHCGCVNVC